MFLRCFCVYFYFGPFLLFRTENKVFVSLILGSESVHIFPGSVYGYVISARCQLKLFTMDYVLAAMLGKS